MRLHTFIYSVTIVSITKALLDKPVENVLRHTQTLSYFMFLAAKIAVASAWKSPVIDFTLVKQTYLDHAEQKDCECPAI